MKEAFNSLVPFAFSVTNLPACARCGKSGLNSTHSRNPSIHGAINEGVADGWGAPAGVLLRPWPSPACVRCEGLLLFVRSP